jgi:hypothetical protein
MESKLLFYGKYETFISEDDDGAWIPEPQLTEQVQATCHLAEPLNTVDNPMEICVTQVLLSTNWKEVRDLYLTAQKLPKSANDPLPDPIRVLFPPLTKMEPDEIASYIAKRMELKFGGKSPALRVVVAQRGDKIVWKVGHRWRITPGPILRNIFNLPATMSNTNTGETTKNFSHIPKDQIDNVKDDLYVLHSPQVSPTFHLNSRMERFAYIFPVLKVRDVRDLETIDVYECKYVPLEAMLHQEKITLYLRHFSSPHIPIYATSYQLFVYATIRPIRKVITWRRVSRSDQLPDGTKEPPKIRGELRMVGLVGKKRRKTMDVKGNVRLEDVLADLAAEDIYDFERSIKSYTHERFQPTSMLPTDTESRSSINFRFDPNQNVHYNTRDSFLELLTSIQMKKTTDDGE